jgi:hypothetical protein
MGTKSLFYHLGHSQEMKNNTQVAAKILFIASRSSSLASDHGPLKSFQMPPNSQNSMVPDPVLRLDEERLATNHSLGFSGWITTIEED